MQMKKCQGAERDEEIVSFLPTQEGEKEEQSRKWKKGGGGRREDDFRIITQGKQNFSVHQNLLHLIDDFRFQI